MGVVRYSVCRSKKKWGDDENEEEEGKHEDFLFCPILLLLIQQFTTYGGTPKIIYRAVYPPPGFSSSGTVLYPLDFSAWSCDGSRFPG